MPSQGPTIVSTGSQALDGPQWANPTNAASASQYASCSLSSAGHTATLKCQFNAGTFSIPGGATIDGLIVSFSAYLSGNPATVSSVLTSLTSANKADSATLTSSAATYSYGNSGDTWGGGATASNINGAWEIDLQFNTTFGETQVLTGDVTATVYYSAADFFNDESGGGGDEWRIRVPGPDGWW